jgi:hypothetical protein
MMLRHNIFIQVKVPSSGTQGQKKYLRRRYCQSVAAYEKTIERLGSC